ncbi:hypothetical protein D3C84_812890 [compost metagenome]
MTEALLSRAPSREVRVPMLPDQYSPGPPKATLTLRSRPRLRLSPVLDVPGRSNTDSRQLASLPRSVVRWVQPKSRPVPWTLPSL